jgi:hypothetical protein
LEHSQDFQWSPSKVFWSRDNPYQIYLDGNIDKKIILSQIPNYAQLLYVLFLPFASMSFAAAKMVWAIVNIAFAISTALLSGKIFGLSRVQSLIVMSIFLMSTPARNAIGNGQHSLLVLAAFVFSLSLGEFSAEDGGASLPLVRRGKAIPSALLAGLTYVKYSYAPSLGSGFFRRYGLQYFLITLLPVLAGTLFFAVWTGESFLSLELLSQPTKISSNLVALGAGDLLSVLKLYLPKGGIEDNLAKLLCLLLAGGVPFLANRKAQGLEWWSFCSVASLSFVTHLIYDYVFYLFPAILAVKNIQLFRGRAMAALVLCQWFSSSLLVLVGISKSSLMWIGLIVNILSLCYLWFWIEKAPVQPDFDPGRIGPSFGASK